MSDLWESAINFYHLQLVPTIKRMLDRRRLAYTLLTVGVLLISVAALSLLLCHTFAALASYDGLAADYEAYLEKHLTSGNKRSPMPEMRDVLALAKGGAVALSLLLGGLWLFLSAVAVGRVMAAVMESEAYVYGLYMIYGSDRKRLSRGLLVEFLLAGIPSLLLGIPIGPGLYRLWGGAGNISADRLWLTIPCFLLLILLCASVLAKGILGRSCMSLLNAADTSDQVVSPRRSDQGGLTHRRGLLASAWLAFLRMRRHYISLAVAAALVAATVFGTLSYGGAPASADRWSYRLYFPNGITREALNRDFLEVLEGNPSVESCFFKITGSAEELGVHVKLTEAQNPHHEGVFLGAHYATDSIRIACGDGDTFLELGGSITVPEEFSHMDLTELGYTLNAVPAGCAVYVYPKQTGPSLQVQVGDPVTVSLPGKDSGSLGELVESESETVTLRIVDVVEMGSVVVRDGGVEVAPRITEDYLYISPMDYERFDGKTHAEVFTAEEVYPDALFEEFEGTCILAVPEGYFEADQAPDTVTVIYPAEPIKAPFSFDKTKLSDENYYINNTHKATGVYFGSEKDYLADPNAASLLKEHGTKALGSSPGVMERREYRVVLVIRTEAGQEPYLLLPRSEGINFAQLQNDTCAFRLGSISRDAPALNAVRGESYLLTSSRSLVNAPMGSELYIGTSLMGDFVEAMEQAGIPFLVSAPSFSHTRTLLSGRFTMGNTHYILAQPYPYPKPLDSDFYPRYVTGAGSFRNVGSTAEISFLHAKDWSFYALLHEDNIGSLKEESIRAEGTYAVNHWRVSPVGEALPDRALPAGQAVLTASTPEVCPIRPGDTLSVAVRQDTAELLRDPELMGLSGDSLLSYLLERLDYEYITVTVSDVIAGETDTLILSEADLTTVLGQEGIYRDLYMEPHASLSMKEYLDLHAEVQSLVKAQAGTTVIYDENFITKTAGGLEQTTLTRIVGILCLCLIPLLLTASQLLFFGKREEEAILRVMGMTRRECRRLFAAETGLFCGVTVAVSALLCPAGYFVLLLLTEALGLPFGETGFDLALYSGILAAVAVSCAATGPIAYRRWSRPSRATRKRIADTERSVPYEGSGM